MGVYLNIRKKLEHFSIDIEQEYDQGILVIQGESGAGKTTVLNCISGLLTPDQGRIVLGERILFDDGQKINVSARQRNIGYVFQNYALFPNMTVEQNVVYGMKNNPDYRDKTKRQELTAYSEYIMTTLGIGHLKKKYPKHISGGEKQRVALSRAIVTKPELLLLDEPFSALDQNTKQIVYREFAMFNEIFQIPTILITHSRKEAEMFADHCIFMKAGEKDIRNSGW